MVIDFSRIRVLVIGDCMLDRYWRGPTARISPEAPVPVVRVRAAEDRPGGAANVAVNIAALGGRVRLAGTVGADEPGAALRRALEPWGIEPRLHTSDDCPTITKLRVISRQQQLLRLDFEETGSALAYPDDQWDAILADCDAVAVSDYAKGSLPDPQAVIQAARARGLPVVVDPKGQDFTRYRGATVLTPNRQEFEAVAGSAPKTEALAARASEWRRTLDLDYLLLTLSEAGMLWVGEDGMQTVPTRAREVYDVTGAGDTVLAVLTAALAAGQGMEPAVHLANTAAGLVVGKLGTTSVTATELEAARHETGRASRGVVDLASLIERRQGCRRQGERVVMTNGCFDLLHPGHAAYLAEARALGDRLIVAVNDDASVRRLKGPARPINPLDQRMALLSALEAVDWVVPFREDTPTELIERLAPDVLVKGGDYRPEAIAGADAVRRHGGEVVVLPFRPGFSSTAVIERVRQGNGLE